MVSTLEKDKAIGQLRLWLKRGDNLYIIQRSRAENYRTYDVYYLSGRSLERITGYVATATGFRYDKKREAIGVGGSGFNGHEVVRDRISHVLFEAETALGFQAL